MHEPAIAIHELCFAYPDGQPALRGVSLQIAAGEAVGLVGGNGAGKSTLLLLLTGCLTAGSGTIAIGGLLLDRSTLARIRRMCGLVFQDADDQLFMPTVFDDVAFGPMNHGLDPATVEQRVARALAEVGMEHLRERPPHKLSGGEKRSIALASVLASDPEIVLLDEPSSNLDPRSRRRLIRWLQQSSHTRLIATHDLELVVETCTRVIVLDRGELVAHGPVHRILGDADLMTRHGLESPHILQHRHPHT
jgi:cobalt/nickel transport system ATP-binding protein